MVQQGDHKIEGGMEAMKRLLAMRVPPTAVMASNDFTAIGALGAAHAAGLKVPLDLSLVGFDDIAFAHWTQPPLTTIMLSRTELAATALTALERLFKKDNSRKEDYVITTHLVVRGSTRAI